MKLQLAIFYKESEVVSTESYINKDIRLDGAEF